MMLVDKQGKLAMEHQIISTKDKEYRTYNKLVESGPWCCYSWVQVTFLNTCLRLGLENQIEFKSQLLAID